MKYVLLAVLVQCSFVGTWLGISVRNDPVLDLLFF